MIRVFINGHCGKMGREIQTAISKNNEKFEYIGGYNKYKGCYTSSLEEDNIRI